MPRASRGAVSVESNDAADRDIDEKCDESRTQDEYSALHADIDNGQIVHGTGSAGSGGIMVRAPLPLSILYHELNKKASPSILSTMFKNFLMKKMLQSQMKDVPQDVQNKIFDALEKNPKLFENIALEAKKKMDGGMDQMTAVSEAAKMFESDLKSAFGKE